MNKQQLASKIWASANKMRSKIEANEYKDSPVYVYGCVTLYQRLWNVLPIQASFFPWIGWRKVFWISEELQCLC